VTCWGDNFSGQLGTARPRRDRTSGVANLNGVTALAAGGAHTCACAPQAVVCWGDNYNGQLGNGTFTNSSVNTT
jgi:alpha-tubulin suppressor-like RCC1 family protein